MILRLIRNHPIGVSAFVVGLWVIFRLIGWPFSFAGGALLLGWFGYLTWASRAVWLGWLKRRFMKRRPDTPGRVMLAQETETTLGLLNEAAATGPDMSDEQRMLLARSLPGLRMRTGVLLGIPNRSMVEENELLMIEREMARIDASLGRREPVPERAARLWSQTAAPRPLAALGAANPIMGILGSPLTWTAAAFMVPAMAAGVQTMRLENAKDDLTQVRSQLAEAVGERDQWKADYEEAHLAVIQASAQAEQTTETIERERARVAAARRRERELSRDIQERVRDVGAAPDWSLRDAGPLSLGPGPSDPTASTSG